MIDTGQVRFFEPWEFERGGVQWWHNMSPRLLVMLDVFRFMWGAQVHVSGHPRAVGRHDGPSGLGQHNVDKWGEIRAIDSQPVGMTTRDEAVRAIELAKAIGFTGIGLYPHWNGGPGLHLDVRHDRDPGYASTWGAVRGAAGQRFVSLNDALEAMP